MHHSHKKFLQDIQDGSDAEIHNTLKKLKVDLARSRSLIKAGGTLDNPAQIGELRRNIARCLTVLKERELKK